MYNPIILRYYVCSALCSGGYKNGQHNKHSQVGKIWMCTGHVMENNEIHALNKQGLLWYRGKDIYSWLIRDGFMKEETLMKFGTF